MGCVSHACILQKLLYCLTMYTVNHVPHRLRTLPLMIVISRSACDKLPLVYCVIMRWNWRLNRDSLLTTVVCANFPEFFAAWRHNFSLNQGSTNVQDEESRANEPGRTAAISPCAQAATRTGGGECKIEASPYPKGFTHFRGTRELYKQQVWKALLCDFQKNGTWRFPGSRKDGHWWPLVSEITWGMSTGPLSRQDLPQHM